MQLSDKYSLACYEQVAVINEEHGVYLVQHNISKNIFVKKILTVYNPSIYQYLKTHHIKGTPEVLEAVEDNGKLIVIEEYISGRTLRNILDNGTHFSEKQAITIITQLCSILREFHNASPAFIHRDIKPSNIILTSDENVYLIDLNAAKLCHTASSEMTAKIGTVGYAAPEQYGFGDVETEADIYSLGILLNELLTGSPTKDKTVDGHLGEVIQKCTMLDPKARYHSTDELMEAVSHKKHPASAETVRHRNKYLLPGFRSGNLVNMIVALQGYAFIVFMFLTMEVKTEGSESLLWVDRWSFFLCALLAVLFSCNYLNIWHVFQFEKIRKKPIRILAIILTEVVMMLILIFVIAIIESGIRK